MIDTIVLKIPYPHFRITDYSKFGPNTRAFFEHSFEVFRNRPFIKAVNNPKKSRIDPYNYYPYLTLMKVLRRGGFETFLLISFSVPKLLYGNNFDEVEETEFGDLIWRLQERLRPMGVEISDIKCIAEAEVSSVHYSKNIILPDYVIPYSVIQELRKANINLLKGFTQAQYRDEGSAIKIHTNSCELIFYDKLKDLQKAKRTEKGTIEKDYMGQLSLFESLPKKKPFEIIRIELRLGDRKQIRHYLKKIYYPTNVLTFTRLFDLDISKRVLIYSYEQIVNLYPKILLYDFSTIDQLVLDIQFNNPGIRYSKILQLVGVWSILHEKGVRSFRESLAKYSKERWYRTAKELDQLKLPLRSHSAIIFVVLGILKRFETVHMRDHPLLSCSNKISC